MTSGSPIDSHGRPVLIQQDGAPLYLQAPGVWVAARDEALVFADTFAALEFCRNHGLTNVLIAVQLD